MQLTDDQRRKIGEILHYALEDIRKLGWAGNAEQAAELADTFHDLPREIWRDDFELEFFRKAFVAIYQQKHPGGRDFAALVDEVLAMGEVPSAGE
jgi:hypothetical protein